ncbi:MAG: aminotransferase class V-fold PLP-dependent enzyme [Lentisphaeria bacterium]|nr:aminotransferase class V-fold PLP-dependent enzyme [Lentisphaeria bacterium]NQZ67731.1 aminotransferase class V-fold PLP-dependent enzyme [Lentisphaeria bacterium]
MSATLLLGPGPSNCPASVLDALSKDLVGHLDPRFINTMEACKEKLRKILHTKNAVTFPISGTGSAGMEAVLVNILEPGDTIVVGVNGVFGMRIANLAERYGATAIRVEEDWGKPMPYAALEAAVTEHKPKILAVVSGETSTGVYQNMDGLGDLAHNNGALLLADCVTSLAGMPVLLDEWGVDLMYSGTQKCLNCPPGLSPVSFSQRALDVFQNRKSLVPSFYLDLGEILKYIGDGLAKRAYHHTAPVSMVTALDAALDIVLEEGLEARWARHKDAQNYLFEKLAPLNIHPFVEEADRLWPLSTVTIPDGVDEAAVRTALLNDDNIELGGGLGPLAGKVWRIGLMGVNADRAVIDRFVDCLSAKL